MDSLITRSLLQHYGRQSHAADLPSFDQETTDFFRWKVVYARKELEAILQEKTGIDFGILHA